MSSLSPRDVGLGDLMDRVDDPEPPPAPRGARRAKGKRSRSPLTVIGIVLMLVGLSILGYAGYQYYGTNVVSEQAFDIERERMRSEWSNPEPVASPTVIGKPIPGKAMGLLRIPRLGKDYEVPLVAGTTRSALAKGVGVYESSVEPGEIGNFTLAGHRVTNGEPFRRVLEVKKGDLIIVETREAIFTYVMDTSPADLTVQPDDNWVLAPVPDDPGATPTEALITLTTCTDLFRSPDRSVGFGRLQDVTKKN